MKKIRSTKYEIEYLKDYSAENNQGKTKTIFTLS